MSYFSGFVSTIAYTFKVLFFLREQGQEEKPDLLKEIRNSLGSSCVTPKA